MDAGTKQHLFEPFFTTKEKGKGTGLELYTVYGIVKQSRGKILVSSEVDRGTTFTVYFPCAEEEIGAQEDPRTEEVDLKGNERILIAEDENAVRTLIATVLTGFGYSVTAVENGRRALEICATSAESAPQLLITDVVMPDMGGRDLAMKVAELLPGTPILFMSGYTDDAVVHNGVIDEGMPFLQKPFTPRTLAKKVREILGRR